MRRLHTDLQAHTFNLRGLHVIAQRPWHTHCAAPLRNDEVAVLYFFRRGDAALTCETRLNPHGPGYQLVITESGHERIENFAELRNLLAREHELLRAWRAQGWRDADQPPGRRAGTRSRPQ